MRRRSNSQRNLSSILIFLVLVGIGAPLVQGNSFTQEPTGFNHTGVLKLQLEYNWSIWSSLGSTETFEMWIPRIINHSHPIKTGTAPV